MIFSIVAEKSDGNPLTEYFLEGNRCQRLSVFN